MGNLKKEKKRKESRDTKLFNYFLSLGKFPTRDLELCWFLFLFFAIYYFS
jgi:hypothetical protein